MAGIDFKQLRQDATTVIEGLFVATIIECTWKPNSKGNPMWKCKWQIQADQYTGRPIWNNMNLTPDSPAALKMFFGQMAVIGLGADFFDRNPSEDEIANALIGRTAEIKVGKRTWNGADQEEIQEVRPAPAGFAQGSRSGGSAGGTQPTALPQQLPQALPTVVPYVEPVAAVMDAAALPADAPPLPF